MAVHKDFAFVGRLCLDFAQTGDMGFGARYERLTSPSELARWMSLSELGLPNVRVTRADLRTAIRVRGVTWRMVTAAVDRTKASPADMRALNRIATKQALVRALDVGARSTSWYRPTVGQAIVTIAQDAVLLLGDGAQRKRLRRCANSGCQVLFYDDSRPGRRRWCFPNRCGDRVRARAYRERHRA